MKTIFKLLLLPLIIHCNLYAQKEPVVRKSTTDKGLNFVILDAAAWDTDIDDALEFNTKHCSPFDFKGADKELETVAPYLFEFDYNQKGKDSFTAWLIRKYDDTHKAFYLHCDCSMEELRKHLSNFVRVKTEKEEVMFFRFYDPAVMTYMLPQLSVKQAALFFSKINYVAYVDPKTDKELIFAPSEEVKQYIKNSKLPPSETLVFTNEQMSRITKAMQEYNSIEEKAATANVVGRNIVGDLTLPLFNGESDRRVMVEVTINRVGVVTKATVIPQGASMLRSNLKKAAEEAALKTRFNASKDAPEAHTGYIVYRFDKVNN